MHTISKVFSIKKGFPILSLMAMNLIMANGTPTLVDSPFYPIPAYLSSNAEKVKPNVMLLLDSSGSMDDILDVKDPNSLSRLAVAQKIIKEIVENNNASVRWGYSSYHVKDFMPIADNNASEVVRKSQATTVVGETGVKGGTPTVPRFYQMTRYFQGLPPTTSATGHQELFGDWALREAAPSPIQYRCQKNFIISISDGIANDTMTPTENRDDPIFKFGKLYPNDDRDEGLANISNRLYLFAARAFMSDFKTTGEDIEGGSYQDPAYPLQNIMTYTISYGPEVGAAGFEGLEKAAKRGGGKSYQALNSTELMSSLQDAVTNIIATSRPPAPSTYIDNGGNHVGGAISVNFKSGNWSSELTVSGTNPNGSVDSNITKPLIIPTGANRNIWFHSSTNGITKVAVNADTANTFGVSLSEAEQILVPWLQGSLAGTDSLRASTFGDVINGNISITNKSELFLLGANDGMVHVFKKNSNDGYAETFVYMPTSVKRSGSSTIGQTVPMLTRSNYGQMTNVHRYLVDGGSFYRGSEGMTLGSKEFVTGATGRGGAGVYALDMKQIKATGGNKESVLFDITNDTDYSELGYTVGTPLIAYIQDAVGNKKWVTVAGNGYFSKGTNGISNNASGKPGLYLINLEDGVDYDAGSQYKYLQTSGLGVDNGLSSPTAVDVNNDGITDYVYAGDLKGDLYRFNLKPDQRDEMRIVKIFEGDPSKPITSAPAVFKRKDGKLVIIFGTGRLLTGADNSSAAQQSIYGVIDVAADENSVAVAIKPNQLLSQTITESEAKIRMLSTNSLQTANLGWKLDLGDDDGERVVYQPVIYGETVYLTTQIVLPPKSNSLCEIGSSSGYIMSLDAGTGGQPKTSNSHFGEKGSTDYYAGKRVQGYVSSVGGLIMAKASSQGTNTHGQLISGVMNLNLKESSSSLNSNVNGASECKDSAPSLSYSDDVEKIESVTAPACARGTKVRVLSWREVF